MNKKILAALAVVAILIVGTYWALGQKAPASSGMPVQNAGTFDPSNATYAIDGTAVTLVDGKDEVSHTALFGEPVSGDLNNDGKADAAVYLTQDAGGSGTFFYVAATIKTSDGQKGTNAMFLGDRIAPQNIAIQNGKIVANYADRKPGESMVTAPSVGTSARFAYHGNALEKIDMPAQTFTYLVSQEEATKYCNGADMDSAGYRETITVERASALQTAQMSLTDRVKAAVSEATAGQCHDALVQTDISVSDGIVRIAPIDAWAGISIAMCSCKPQVEVNLLRISGVTNVVWE